MLESKNIIIHCSTFNRKTITEICLKQLKRNKREALLWVHDDGSSEYDVEWLKQFADIVTTLNNPYTDGNTRSSFAVLNSFKMILNYSEGKNYTHIYHSDNDMFHDKTYMDSLCYYWNKYSLPVVLYTEPNYGHKGPDRSIPHIPIVEEFDDAIRSCWGQGGSWLFPIKEIEKFNEKYTGNWDGHINNLMGSNFIFAKPALADHYIYDGVHAKDMPPHDLTLNPTKYLQKFRTHILRRLGRE